MFFVLALFLVLALLVYNVIVYLHATGSVWDRLAAAWKGSMTIFALVWSTIAMVFTNGMDALAQITGDPQFATVAGEIKNAVSPEWGQVIVITSLVLPLVVGGLARFRTLGK